MPIEKCFICYFCPKVKMKMNDFCLRSIVTIFSNKLGITYKRMSMPVFLDSSSSYTNAKSSRKNLIKIPFFHLSVTKQPHKLLILSPKFSYFVSCTPNNRCCNTWTWENGMLKMLNALGAFFIRKVMLCQAFDYF